MCPMGLAPTSVSKSMFVIRYKAIFVLREMDDETWLAFNLMITHRLLMSLCSYANCIGCFLGPKHILSVSLRQLRHVVQMTRTIDNECLLLPLMHSVQMCSVKVVPLVVVVVVVVEVVVIEVVVVVVVGLEW